MSAPNLDNLEFKTSVHLDPMQSINYGNITKLFTFREAVSMGNWKTVEQFCADNGLPPFRILNPEYFPEAEPANVKTVKTQVGNRRLQPIFEELDKCAPVAKEKLDSIKRDLREGTQQIFIVRTHFDISESMQGYEEVYPLVDSLCHKAFFKSEVWTKSAEHKSCVFYGTEYFNHKNKIGTHPVLLNKYTRLENLPSVSHPKAEGCTDLRTKLATVYREFQLQKQILNDPGIYARHIHTAQIIYSDGQHDMYNADGDSPITMEDLQLLHKAYVGDKALAKNVIALAAGREALEFFQEVGFKRGKNLMYIKGKGQDYEAFMKNIRRAAAMASNMSCESISESLSTSV